MIVFSWSIESNEIKKEKYTPEKLYTHMKEILRKCWDRRVLLGIHSGDDYPELNNYDISQGNIKCEEFTRQLWNDTTKKRSY